MIVARAVKKKYNPQGGGFFETGEANPCKHSQPHACNFVLCWGFIINYIDFNIGRTIMIETVAEFLERLRDIEKIKIDELNIKHRPTIGNTYEGLTETLLHKAVFKGLNLNIVTNSFIKAPDGTRSDEMDVLLIEGEGELIPYTKEQYDVSYEKVIAVFQVKKKLNKNQITDSYENLKNVIDHADQGPMPNFSKRLFRDSYRGICKQDIIEKGKERKTFESSTTEMIYHILKVESTFPARIVFAYEGYASEYGLREGFVKFLSENKSNLDDMKYGFGPLNFPNLIINKDFTLIKGDGMPYGSRLLDGQWAFYLSSSEKPLLKLLEVIWTQLSYRYELPIEIFGEDIEKEGTNIFLKANLVNISGFRAWNLEYVNLKKKTLKNSIGNKEWEPYKLTEDQHHIMALLCAKVEMSIKYVENELKNSFGNVDISLVIKGILETELVYLEHQKIKLLTDKCRTAFVPGFGYCVAEDKSGRFTRWTDKYMKNHTNSKANN